MEADGHRVSALHGAFEGQSRDTLLDDFRTGKSKVLITTNVIARGIDIANVNNQNSWLGRSLFDGDAGLKGSIDEFRIWNGPLTPSGQASPAGLIAGCAA